MSIRPKDAEISYRGNYYKRGLRNKIYFWALDKWVLSSLSSEDFEHLKANPESNKSKHGLYRSKKGTNVKKNTTGVKK